MAYREEIMLSHYTTKVAEWSLYGHYQSIHYFVLTKNPSLSTPQNIVYL